MARHILIIEKSDMMRRVLQTRILANLDDVIISEAINMDQGLEVLTNSTVHLVFYSYEELENSDFNFVNQIRSHTGDAKLRCLLLVDDKEEYMSKLAENYISDYLRIPFTAKEVADTINAMCSPTSLRASKRYSIPGTEATIEQNSNLFNGTVLNISAGGVLCEFEWKETYRPAYPVMIALQFFQDGDVRSADGLDSVLTSMKVIERNPDYTPHMLRVGFSFVNIPDKSNEVLAKVFELAEEQEGK